MHIIITIITALAGLVWALYRLHNSGVDLNSFNPFWWMRRRKWQKMHGTKPLHQINSSLDAAAVLTAAVAELDGVITKEIKEGVIENYEKAFNINTQQAAELYGSSVHLLKESINPVAEVKKILAPTINEFSDKQIQILFSMMESVAKIDGEINERQNDFISAVKNEFKSTAVATNNW